MTAVRPHVAVIDIAMQKLPKAKATAGGGGGSSKKGGGGSGGGGKGAADAGGPVVHKKAELLKQAWGAVGASHCCSASTLHVSACCWLPALCMSTLMSVTACMSAWADVKHLVNRRGVHWKSSRSS